MTELSILVDRWVEGWGDSRGMTRRRNGDTWTVEVASALRTREYVAASPSPDVFHGLVSQMTAPDIWFTIIGDLDPWLRDAAAGLPVVNLDERLMTSALGPTAIPTQVRIDEEGRVGHARIEIEGEIAARGQAAVRGTDVIFDRIETSPPFRRRGLGRLVMGGLSGWAAANGATTGLLLASVEGQQLYRSLGWQEVAPVVTLSGPAGI